MAPLSPSTRSKFGRKRLFVVKAPRSPKDRTPWVARWRGATRCRAETMEAALAGGLKWLATHRLPKPGPIVALAPEPKVYYLIHDWEYEEWNLGRTRSRRQFAGTPEKAAALIAAGVKLTPLYTRHVE